MAGFFNLPSSRATTKRDMKLLQKAQKPTPTANTVSLKGTTKMIDRIESIMTLVKAKFAGKEDELILIQEEEQLVQYIDKCIENNMISIDTETTGLDPILNQLVGICIYTPGMKAAYIPVNHISYITEVRCDGQLPVEFIREQFQRLVDENVRTVWFNAPFDIRFLGNHIGVWFMNPYFDTSIASRVLNSNEPPGQKSLKALHKKYCWGNRGEALTFGKLFDDVPFNLVPISAAYLYAASDAIYTYELYQFQAQYLEPTGKYYHERHMEDLSYVFFEIEMKSMPTFISMEQTGVTIDYEHAKKISERYHALKVEMQKKLDLAVAPYQDLFDDYRRLHPDCRLTEPINFESTIQLAIVLYDILKIPPVDKKNPRATGADILQKIDHPICKAVLDNRAFNKVISTYIDKLPALASEYPDKRIHCKFNQYGADCITGDSLILTDTGYIRIDSLFDGTEHNGEFYPCNVTVTNINLESESASYKIVFYDTDTIKITLRGGYSFEGTPNHPVICLNENTLDFKKLDEMTIGDIVAIPYGYDIFPTEYVPTELKINSNHEYQVPETLDEEFAEFLGMYHADGTVRDDMSHYTVTLWNKNDDVIKRFKYLVKKLFGIDCKECERGGTIGTYFNSTSFRCLSKYLIRGARNKHIPDDVMKSPKSVIAAYIKGMTLDSSFDRKRQRLSMTIADKVSHDFIKQYLLNIGILSGSCIYEYDASKDHAGNEVDAKNMYRLCVVGDMYKRFLDNIGVIESKKILIADNYKKSQYLSDGKYYYAYITKIEHSKNTVYDLTVPNTHSFIANGVINHNTGRVTSDQPNLQNIPSNPFTLSDGTKIDSGHDVRQLFRATEGYVLMSCDYSGQEVRLTAHMSHDRKMIQAYIDGKDVYSEIASLAFNVPYEDCCEHRADGTPYPEGKKRRGESKKIVLGRHIIAPVYGDICRKVGERICSAVCN